MNRGKRTCRILKEIRQQIALQNNIEYVTSECHFQGECKGSCPKCEAEVIYLENELKKRHQLGKAVSIAGISLGLAASFSACNSPRKEIPAIPSEIPIETISETPPLPSPDTVNVPPEPDTKCIAIDGLVFNIVGDVEFGESEPIDQNPDYKLEEIPFTDQLEHPDEYPPPIDEDILEGDLILPDPGFPDPDID